MSSDSNRPDRPTRRQLVYLRSLATRTGQTFTYPHTRRQASREIEREIADAIARGEADAARVQAREVSGYGSTAAWKERS